MAFWTGWFGRSLTPQDPALYSFYGRQENWAGESVSVQGALNLSAWWAASRITSQTVASLSFEVMEPGPDGVKVRAPDHPLQRLLDGSPNADQTAIEFWEGRVLGLCTTGNGFAEKVEGTQGLVALNPLPADTVVRRAVSGDLEYRFLDRGKYEVLPADKIFHIKGFGDGDVGMSPVAYARQTLSIVMATEKLAGQSFSKGLRSKGFFIMPGGGRLTAEQRADARKTLIEANSGSDAPWAGILEGGVDFKSVAISMKDAEMLMNRRFNVEDICRWLGIPPVIIGHSAEGQTMWGTGVDSIMRAWYTLGLRTYLKRIEQAIFKRVLTVEQRAAGLSVRINYEDLLRADTAARATFYTSMLQDGVFTINEVRRREGLPPVEGGDVPRIQMQNTPITASAPQTDLTRPAT